MSQTEYPWRPFTELERHLFLQGAGVMGHLMEWHAGVIHPSPLVHVTRVANAYMDTLLCVSWALQRGFIFTGCCEPPGTATVIQHVENYYAEGSAPVDKTEEIRLVGLLLQERQKVRDFEMEVKALRQKRDDLQNALLELGREWAANGYVSPNDLVYEVSERARAGVYALCSQKLGGLQQQPFW